MARLYNTHFILILMAFIFLIKSTSTHGQNELMDVKFQVVDANSFESLAFANVVNQSQQRATSSNEKGRVDFPDVRRGDTIVISYVAYLNQTFIVQKENPDTIFLRPNDALIEEVVLSAKTDFYYDLITQVRKNRHTKKKTAKTYFYLDTKIGQDTTEIIESYNNGEYADYGLDHLYYKKSRIGLKPKGNRFFVSTSSSRLFYLHTLFEYSTFFPENPLSMSKSKLKRKYDYACEQIYMEGNARIYQIHVRPKDPNQAIFDATIWIDQTNMQLVKINLSIEDASVHPFIPIGMNTVKRVDMQISKTFQSIEGESFLHYADFNYQVDYVDQDNLQFSSNTHAYINAYNFEKPFVLPFYQFSEAMHQDYRNASVSPYDTSFWQKSNEFRWYDRKEIVEEFVTQNRFNNEYLINQESEEKKRLQFPYTQWSRNRMLMTQAPYEAIEKSQSANAYGEDRYQFNCQLYLDFNVLEDSVYVQLYAVFDPIGSFYLFPIEVKDQAFLNMYFDLLEIQRRKLEKEINSMKKPSKKEMEKLYDTHMAIFQKESSQLILDTNRGSNHNQMQNWNTLIKDQLDVDNLAYFNLN